MGSIGQTYALFLSLVLKKISALFRFGATVVAAEPMGRRRASRRRAWTASVTTACVAAMIASDGCGRATRAHAMPGVSVRVRGVRAVPKCFPDCVDARLDVVEAREGRHDPGWAAERDVILIEALAEEATEAVRDFADWTGLVRDFAGEGETFGIDGTEGETDPRVFWTRLESAMNRIELNLN